MRATSNATVAPVRSTSPLLSISDAAQRLGVHVNTLRLWSDNGTIPTLILPSGHRRYRNEDINRFMGLDESESDAEGNMPIALVARVSTQKQSTSRTKGGKSDLDRQEERLAKWAAENHPDSPVTMYSRTSSGMNFECPVFLRLVNDLLAGKYNGGLVVAVHPERICRFGLSLVREIAKKGGAQLVFIGEKDEKTEYESLADDVIAVLTSFSAKIHGRRAAVTCQKHVSEDCIKRMVELRQANYGIKEIAETLNREGYRTGPGKDESQWKERITRHKVSKLLDSNGTEAALTVVVGMDKPEKPALDSFLESEVEREEGSRLGATEFRQLYERWCGARGIQPEKSNMIGTRLRERGIILKKSNGKRWVYGVRQKAA